MAEKTVGERFDEILLVIDRNMPGGLGDGFGNINNLEDPGKALCTAFYEAGFLECSRKALEAFNA